MVSANSPAQGDVWLVDFSPVVGREQAGRRPALVLSRDDHNRSSAVVTVAPLTSSLAMRGHPGAVFLAASETGGAKKDSLVLIFQVRTIDKTRCERRLFRLADPDLSRVWDALYAHFERHDPSG